MKLALCLTFWCAVPMAHGLEFDAQPLGEGEGARLEVLSILLPAGDAAVILDGFDGSDEAAAECFGQLNAKVANGSAEGEVVYKESKAAGVWGFEESHDDGKKDSERLLSLRLGFHRDAKCDRVWAYGFVTPSYRFEAEDMAVNHPGEMTLVSSGFAPGIVRLLGVVPAAFDRDERTRHRVRVLFGKLTATEEAVKTLTDHEAGVLRIGVVATEVMLPLAEYEGVDALGLEGADLVETLLEQRGARVLAVYAGETVHNGRIRQRAAWGTDSPVAPNYGHGCLFDCDPVAVEAWRQEDNPPLDPPPGAKGVVIGWFGWERVLARPEPVITRTFRWNENWEKPGVRVVEEAGAVVKGGGQFALWLPDGDPQLAAVSVLGEAGAKDRQVILLCVRAYTRPL